MRKFSKNIQTVIDILQDEVRGDIPAALKKMSVDYTMTWVYVGTDGNKLFPTTKKDIRRDIAEAYVIKGRQYDIRSIAEGDGVVFVELIESYPDPKTKKVYRTPLVLVLEMQNGKIKTGRHYCDPRLSGKYLSIKQVGKAYKNHKGSTLVIR